MKSSVILKGSYLIILGSIQGKIGVIACPPEKRMGQQDARLIYLLPVK